MDKHWPTVVRGVHSPSVSEQKLSYLFCKLLSAGEVTGHGVFLQVVTHSLQNKALKLLMSLRLQPMKGASLHVRSSQSFICSGLLT
jgi:hypothetical protein